MRTQISGLGGAIELYVATHLAPMPEQGWYALLGWPEWYEFDPWGARFVYRPGPELIPFDLRSKGADGVLDTDDDFIYGDLESGKRCKSINNWTVLYRRYKVRAGELL